MTTKQQTKLSPDINQVMDILHSYPEMEREKAEAIVWDRTYKNDLQIQAYIYRLGLFQVHIQYSALLKDGKMVELKSSYPKNIQDQIDDLQKDLSEYISNNYPKYLFGCLKK